MICTPTNAYPNNVTVDTSKNWIRSIKFNGDFTIGYDCYLYDYNTQKLISHTVIRDNSSSGGFYNNETIETAVLADSIDLNKEYMWQAQFFEDIDTSKGRTPSILNSTGRTLGKPYQEAVVQSKIGGNKYGENEYGKSSIQLTPKDANLKEYSHYYMYVYWLGHGVVRAMYFYDTGLLTFKTEFDETPSEGETLYISPNKTSRMDEIVAETGCVYIRRNQTLQLGTHKGADKTTEISNCYLKINDNFYGITKYYSEMGVLGLDTAIDGIESLTPYEIYNAFVLSPMYYFKTQSTPTVSANAKIYDEFIKCSADISINGVDGVKYFYWTIYDGKTTNIIYEQTKKIYSGRLSYVYRNVEEEKTYLAEITIETQNGFTIKSNKASITIPKRNSYIRNLSATVNTARNCVRLEWESDGNLSQYSVYRKDSNGNLKLLDMDLKNTTSGNRTYFDDFSAVSGETYEYLVTPVERPNGYIYHGISNGKNYEAYHQESITVKPKFNDWSIYFCTEKPCIRGLTGSMGHMQSYIYETYTDRGYDINSIWKVQISPDIGDIKHNIKRDESDAYNGKPAITYGNMNYDSFTLTFDLGKLSCPENKLVGIDTNSFQRWKEQINSKRCAVIKDPLGNIWFGVITEHNYTPDYTGQNYQLYTIKIDFVQTKDMKDIMLCTD